MRYLELQRPAGAPPVRLACVDGEWTRVGSRVPELRTVVGLLANAVCANAQPMESPDRMRDYASIGHAFVRLLRTGRSRLMVGTSTLNSILHVSDTEALDIAFRQLTAWMDAADPIMDRSDPDRVHVTNGSFTPRMWEPNPDQSLLDRSLQPPRWYARLLERIEATMRAIDALRPWMDATVAMDSYADHCLVRASAQREVVTMSSLRSISSLVHSHGAPSVELARIARIIAAMQHPASGGAAVSAARMVVYSQRCATEFCMAFERCAEPVLTPPPSTLSARFLPTASTNTLDSNVVTPLASLCFLDANARVYLEVPYQLMTVMQARCDRIEIGEAFRRPGTAAALAALAWPPTTAAARALVAPTPTP